MAKFNLPRWGQHDRVDVDYRRNALRRFLRSDENVDLAADAADYLSADLLGPVGVRQDRHNTEVAYRSDARRYIAAAMAASEDPLDPTFPFWQGYFTDYAASCKINTVYRHSFGIAALFFQYGLPSPTRTPLHRQLLRALARKLRRETQHAIPLFGNEVIALLDGFDRTTLCGLRDYTICLFGATRGFRSITIVSVLIEDITIDERGIMLILRAEKTAYHGEPVYTGTIHTRNHRHCMPCETQRLVAALKVLGIDSGPLFRPINRWGQLQTKALTPPLVTEILKRGLSSAGIPNSNDYTSHSFRHGVVASGLLNGWTMEQIMAVTMHRSLKGLEPYTRSADPWHRSPEQCILDCEFPPEPLPGQGWNHVP